MENHAVQISSGKARLLWKIAKFLRLRVLKWIFANSSLDALFIFDRETSKMLENMAKIWANQNLKVINVWTRKSSKSRNIPSVPPTRRMTSLGCFMSYALSYQSNLKKFRSIATHAQFINRQIFTADAERSVVGNSFCAEFMASWSRLPHSPRIESDKACKFWRIVKCTFHVAFLLGAALITHRVSREFTKFCQERENNFNQQTKE